MIGEAERRMKRRRSKIRMAMRQYGKDHVFENLRSAPKPAVKRDALVGKRLPIFLIPPPNFAPRRVLKYDLSFLFRIGSQTEKNLRSFSERFGGEFAVRELGQVAFDEGIDGLTILTGVDFHTLAAGFESLNDGKGLRLEGVESQLDALHIVIAPPGVSGTGEDARFENAVGTLEVEHFREFGVAAENLIPRFQIVG